MKLKTITFLLTLLAAVASHAAPFAYSVNSDGPDSNTSDSLHLIDLADGTSQIIGKVRPTEPNINSDIEGLAFDVNGMLYGVDDADETLLSISVISGQATSVTGNAFNLQLGQGQIYDFGMTFTCNNELLVSSDKTQTLYSSELANPPVVVIGSISSLVLPITGIAARGGRVYGIGQGVDDSLQTLTPNLYRIDPDNGTTTLIGPLSGSITVAPYADAGLAFDAIGQLWALTDRSDFSAESELVRINAATGAALEVMQVGVIGFESIAIAPPGDCEHRPRGIPATGRTSLVLLSLFLTIFGLVQLRRYN